MASARREPVDARAPALARGRPLPPVALLLLLIRDLGNLDRPAFGGGLVGRCHHAMRCERIVEAGEPHLGAALQRVEECLELRLVWMIADVAAVEQLHRQFAPVLTVESGELLRMKLVI